MHVVIAVYECAVSKKQVAKLYVIEVAQTVIISGRCIDPTVQLVILQA